MRLHPEAFPDRPWLECARPDCGYKTKMEGDFSRHVVKHTDKYACSECDKRYGRESELQHHMRSHDDTLKYRCQWPGCDRLFTSQTNYKYHMNGHTGETVYTCEWEGCGKTSLSLKAIKNHMSKEHKC
ncbi:unnamed protein product [Oppiella nova]|uniref:C2H2-type domain-containing protein n=1 Tax=Oppiella nova TaxID=334625 RepID=A0A7R9QXC2_9ACAR|nr:unnamed protein product [Oppiella nova]CAG2179077.1 unnamed protein product [Oppiella nova]